MLLQSRRPTDDVERRRREHRRTLQTPRLDPPLPSAYHPRMEEDVQTLSGHVEKLLANMQRLIDENSRLKAELSSSQSRNNELRQRMADARSRVELALARLPADAGDRS